MSDWKNERPDHRVESYYGTSILKWLKDLAAKDPRRLSKPGTEVRLIVEKAFEKATRAKKAKVTT